MQTVIIGNSAAGLNALETFRRYNQNSSVVMVSREDGPAYSRVLLPYYLSRKIGWKGLFLNLDEYYRRHRVKTYFKNPAVKIDPGCGTVELSRGEQIRYDQLLIATGSVPVEPPIKNINLPEIFHLWTLQDLVDIEKRFCAGKKLVVLGSGFISMMAADAAAGRGLSVTVVELMPRIMPRVLDEQSAALLSDNILAHGVKIKVGSLVEKVETAEDGSLTLSLQDGSNLAADLVIVGTGVKPGLDLVNGSPVLVDRGILVNNMMETNISGIYAAGDVAQGPSVFGKKHELSPLWFSAVEHGKIAGANMAGQHFVYEGSLNLNVTQLFGLTVASLGRFEPGTGLEQELYHQNGAYAALFREGMLPVGAVVAGPPWLVRLLGFLRPFVRYRKKLRFTLKQLIDRCR